MISILLLNKSTAWWTIKNISLLTYDVRRGWDLILNPTALRTAKLYAVSASVGAIGLPYLSGYKTGFLSLYNDFK